MTLSEGDKSKLLDEPGTPPLQSTPPLSAGRMIISLLFLSLDIHLNSSGTKLFEFCKESGKS